MSSTNNVIKMKELIAKIREADKAYFGNDAPIMSDRAYDALVEELKRLEAETGITFAGSPTGRVSGEVKKGLETVRHSKPMLSANKTKSMQEFKRFAEGQNVVLSWKMDGLTLVLRYEKGSFVQAITRGSDGMIGEDVTAAVRHFRNIPHRVSCKDPFEVRSEGVCSWEDHKVIGKNSADAVSHPRNTAAGLVRALSPDRGKLAHLDFYAFELIKSEQEPPTKLEQLHFLSANGFTVVPHTLAQAYSGSDAIEDAVNEFDPEQFAYPADGIVAEYDDIAYGKSLGATAHHENRMLALKWQDELQETVFRGVELITTRTGVVSIVGLFDPVIIEGSQVKRANLHNLGIFESFRFGIGDTIKVYKANMIIPQIAENLTKSGTYELPKFCPCCGERLTVKFSAGGVKELYCPNEDCIARNAQKIARFCDKAAMNIEGLSAVTLEKLMAYGWVKSYADLYHLEDHREEIAMTTGFGIASYNKMHDAIEKSRRTTLGQFLIAVGIPLMGPQAAKILNDYYYGNWKLFEKDAQEGFAFSHIEGISPTLEKNIHRWYRDAREEALWRPVLKEVTFMERSRRRENAGAFTDANVVITGTLSTLTRKQAHELLNLIGANPSDSVTQNTDYLIVGMDPGNKKISKALQYGVTILYEQQFAEMLGQET